MDDFKTRLIQECDDLALKVAALEKFLGSEKFEALAGVERKDLRIQHGYMIGYQKVLSGRALRLCY